jgi:restriction system protein
VPIPDFQTIMLPLMRLLADGRDCTMRELTRKLADQFSLSEQDLAALLPSGQQTIFSNRVSWAKAHLKAAGLLLNPSRGKVLISEVGRDVLAENPPAIGIGFLRRFPSYCEFKRFTERRDDEGGDDGIPPIEETHTPVEIIEAAYNSLRQATMDDLIARLKSCSPSFFESVVVKLLLAMGYGGVSGHGSVTPRSGDGGIDGVIKQDKLGLDVVCIQAKRWEGPVGRPVIQGFVGSMDFYRAKKGVIITTSTFTRDAQDFVERIEGKKVVLIDGEQLGTFMVEHNLGTVTTKTYEIKEVSNDFFDESGA